MTFFSGACRFSQIDAFETADIFCTSVVDHTILIPDELVYLLSEHGGDENVEAYLSYLLRIWARLKQIRANPLALTDGQSLPAKVNKTPTKADTYAVGGYGEEMVEEDTTKTLTPEQKEILRQEKEIKAAGEKAAQDEMKSLAKVVKQAKEKAEDAKRKEIDAERLKKVRGAKGQGDKGEENGSHSKPAEEKAGVAEGGAGSLIKGQESGEQQGDKVEESGSHSEPAEKDAGGAGGGAVGAGNLIKDQEPGEQQRDTGRES